MKAIFITDFGQDPCFEPLSFPLRKPWVFQRAVTCDHLAFSGWTQAQWPRDETSPVINKIERKNNSFISRKKIIAMERKKNHCVSRGSLCPRPKPREPPGCRWIIDGCVLIWPYIFFNQIQLRNKVSAKQKINTEDRGPSSGKQGHIASVFISLSKTGYSNLQQTSFECEPPTENYRRTQNINAAKIPYW